MKSAVSNLRLLAIVFFLMCLSGNIKSQGIGSIVVFPGAPTSADSIKVVAMTWLPYAACWVEQYSAYTLGQDIYIDARYNSGMLTVICSHTDTFRLGPLPPGNYTGHFNLIYPWPTANIAATSNFNVNVGGSTGSMEPDQGAMIRITPNPVIDMLELTYKAGMGQAVKELQIYNLQGIKVKSIIPAFSPAGKISLSLEVPAGVYFLVLRSDKTILARNLFTIIH